MKKSTLALSALLLGMLIGSVMTKSAHAAADEGVSAVVHQLSRIADAVSEIKRDGLKCHE